MPLEELMIYLESKGDKISRSYFRSCGEKVIETCKGEKYIRSREGFLVDVNGQHIPKFIWCAS